MLAVRLAVPDKWWFNQSHQQAELLRLCVIRFSSQQVNNRTTSTKQDWSNKYHLGNLWRLQTEGAPQHDPTTHNPTAGVASFPHTFLPSTPPLSCPPNESDQDQDYPVAGPFSTSSLLSISQGRVTSDAWQPGGLFVTVESSTPGQY